MSEKSGRPIRVRAVGGKAIDDRAIDDHTVDGHAVGSHPNEIRAGGVRVVHGHPVGVRALPVRPNLEFERKRAKGLVRRSNGAVKLAETQRAIASGYGFSNWGTLVAYYRTWELHEKTGPDFRTDLFEFYNGKVRSILHEFKVRNELAEQPDDLHGTGAMLASFVPRFYGLTDAEIFASTLDEREAQLAVARQQRFPSWTALQEFAKGEYAKRDRQSSPVASAVRAMRGNGHAALRAVVTEHPELLREFAPEVPYESFLWNVQLFDMRERSTNSRRVWDWVVNLGSDLQMTMNRALLGFIKTSTSDVEFLLERGADPTWLPPNGVSVLEHALMRYWNGEGVDLIARRVKPKRAFWIAAGLGDVQTMRTFFDRSGTLRESARRHRPDFMLAKLGVPCRPNASDRHLIFEAFNIAAMNARASTVDALLELGHSIDYSPWDLNPLQWAVGNEVMAAAELLISRGANLDYKRTTSFPSAREFVQNQLDRRPGDANVQRLHTLMSNSPGKQ